MPEKLITADIRAIKAYGGEREKILRLRSLIFSLTASEKLSLVLSLVHFCSGERSSLSIEASTALGQDLASAILQASVLSPKYRLALAIELLELVFENEHGV